MKTISTLILVFLSVLSDGNPGDKPGTEKLSFGIYETVKIKEIPISFVNSLKTSGIKFENDSQLPIIGYMQKAAFLNLKVNLSTESFKLAKTVYPVDKDGQYYAIVVIKQNPVIVTSDIKKTANKGNSIEIYFTLSGAKKWADLTKNNIGKKLAFVIDNEIYAMPDINGEINYGVAKISGLESETVAEKLSVSLNRSISN